MGQICLPQDTSSHDGTEVSPTTLLVVSTDIKGVAARLCNKYFTEQCKEIKENNTMEKTRDVFKKIKDTKGTFHPKMSTIKNTNDMDLTEAEDI